MGRQTIHIVSETIRYIEDHLDDKLELDMIAAALHYSKFYLHRIFTKTAGLTLHDYVGRRKLTEAAKLLAFSEKPVIEIALMSGYESQQAFTDIFKEMYKITPAKFRKAGEFYPLQQKIHLNERIRKTNFSKEDIQFAEIADMGDWMKLVSAAMDGYPYLNEEEYVEKLKRYIAEQKALILRDGNMAAGIMGFSTDAGSIDFLAVHPQYRNLDIPGLFLDKLKKELIFGKEISVTTYRAGDKADTGYRKAYQRLGFVERELLMEYGYPTQRFVLCLETKEEA